MSRRGTIMMKLYNSLIPKALAVDTACLAISRLGFVIPAESNESFNSSIRQHDTAPHCR